MTVGGQAVLEGVMMRSPGNWAVAVRTPAGSIAQVTRPIESAMARHWALRLPVVRGVMALGESLAIGFRALAISASYAAQDEGQEGEEVQTELSRGALIFAFAIAIGFAVALFKVTPGLITEALPIKSGGWFVVVEGLIRVAIFVAYLSLISLLPDLRRVFQYHGAEHKVISCYEASDELTPERAQLYSRFHPRCGTSFLLIVMIMAIFVFAPIGLPAWWILVITRIVGVPLIAGLSFEVIKWAGRNRRRPWVRAVMYPGMQLQRLTTAEPALDQLAVSIASLKAVLAKQEGANVSPEDLVGLEVVA